jgi:hypothetical protein
MEKVNRSGMSGAGTESCHDHDTWPAGSEVIAEAVASADKISSGLSAERLAFAEVADWKKLGKLSGYRYLRLALS